MPRSSRNIFLSSSRHVGDLRFDRRADRHHRALSFLGVRHTPSAAGLPSPSPRRWRRTSSASSSAGTAAARPRALPSTDRRCAPACPRRARAWTFFSAATSRTASLSPVGLRHLGVLGDLLLDRVEVGERELGVDGLDVATPGRPCPRRAPRSRPRSSARRARSRRSRGCWRGTCCPGPRPSTRRRPGRRCRRTRPRPARPSAAARSPAIASSRGSGTGDDADVRLDGAERIVLGRDAGLGERVEQGGLADVRQADDAALHVISCRTGTSGSRRLFRFRLFLAAAFTGASFFGRLGSSSRPASVLSGMQLLHRALQVARRASAAAPASARSIAWSIAALSSADGFCST